MVRGLSGAWRALAAGLLALALGGCTMVSETPLFSPAVRPQHPLADGVWAMTEPGCEVVPNLAGALPDCAARVEIHDGRMSWDPAEAIKKQFGPASLAVPALPVPKASHIVVVDGDPVIVELLNDEPPPPPPGQTTPMPPLKPGYLALRSLELDPAGRIVRAAAWPLMCPMGHSPLPPGVTKTARGCFAQSADVIRRQAATPPFMIGVFLTWVGPGG